MGQAEQSPAPAAITQRIAEARRPHSPCQSKGKIGYGTPNHHHKITQAPATYQHKSCTSAIHIPSSFIEWLAAMQQPKIHARKFANCHIPCQPRAHVLIPIHVAIPPRRPLSQMGRASDEYLRKGPPTQLIAGRLAKIPPSSSRRAASE